MRHAASRSGMIPEPEGHQPASHAGRWVRRCQGRQDDLHPLTSVGCETPHSPAVCWPCVLSPELTARGLRDGGYDALGDLFDLGVREGFFARL